MAQTGNGDPCDDIEDAEERMECMSRNSGRLTRGRGLKKILPVIVLMFALGVPLVLVSLVPSASAYGDGYGAGYTYGYESGFNAGNLTGYGAGYEKGAADGNYTGYAQGYIQGYNDGVVDGNYTGYMHGFSIGYSDGYLDGYLGGYDDGHDDGYVDGVIVGYALGYANGTIDGYSSGYSDGFADGEWEQRTSGWITLPSSYNTLSSCGLKNITWLYGDAYDLIRNDECPYCCVGTNFTVHGGQKIDWGWEMVYVSGKDVYDVHDVILESVINVNKTMNMSLTLFNQFCGTSMFLDNVTLYPGRNEFAYQIVGKFGTFPDMVTAESWGMFCDMNKMFAVKTTFPTNYTAGVDYSVCIDRMVCTFQVLANMAGDLYTQFYDIPGYECIVPVTLGAVAFAAVIVVSLVIKKEGCAN